MTTENDRTPKINPPPPISTPTQTPWVAFNTLIDRIDTLIAVYESRSFGSTVAPTTVILEGEESGYTGGAAEVSVSIGSQIRTPWRGQDPVEIFNESPVEAKPMNSKMFNWSNGKRLLIWVESTLDQDITLQVKGNIRNNITNGTEIGPSIPCSANGNVDIGLAWDDWHPYIGVEVTIPTAPTSGNLKIEVVEQV